MGELLHEIHAFRTHSQPGAIVQGYVTIQNPVHDLSHGLLVALLQCGPAKICAQLLESKELIFYSFICCAMYRKEMVAKLKVLFTSGNFS